MRKFIFAFFAVLTVALLGITGQAHAGIGVGLEYAIPTGDFADIAAGGGGLNVEYTMPLNDNTEIGGGVGFVALGGQEWKVGDVKILETSYTAMPIGVQGRYFFNGVEEGGIFVGAKIGLAVVNYEVTLVGIKGDESASGYFLAPGVGFRTGKIQVDGG